MKTKAFAAVAALVLAAPLAALADNPPPSSISPTSTTPARTAAARSAFAGSVTAVDSTSLTVDVLWSRRGTAGGSVTVAIDPQTKIVFGKGKSSISVGDLVRVIAADSTARRIHVDCNCHFAAGTLDSLSGSQIKIHVERTGPYDTVLKGNDVTFQLGSPAAAANVLANAKVAVRFSANGFFRDPSFDWQNATFTVTHLRLKA